MPTAPKKDRTLLLATASDIVQRLQSRGEETSLRIRRPRKAHEAPTDGWVAFIGDLGTGSPRLQVWFDRYAGYPTRKLWAGFFSRDAKAIDKMAKDVSDRLWPIRELTEADTNETGCSLAQRLKREEFNEPVLEHYERWRGHFFGFYDPTRQAQTAINTQFCESAVAFFLDVSPQSGDPPSAPPEVYPRHENRKVVTSHLGRERSGYLATQCKIRDDYECQVCGMKFAEVYGDGIGANFAEAHHIKPLGTLPDKVKTRLEDLVTVCANCHRMLHQMDGKADDIKKLRALVRRHRGLHQ